MNKLKAIFTVLCIIVLYYIIRPIHCLFQAVIETLIQPEFNMFIDIYMFCWKEDYVELETYWLYVKEMWHGKI